MSASTQAAPRQISFGRMPSVLAILALITVIAVAVSLVALNGAKKAAPATGPKAAPPPAVIDHGWSSAVYGQSVTNVPYYDHGWSGINEPGQSVTNVPFYDHDYSQKGTSSAVAIPFTGPYYNGGAFAAPPAIAAPAVRGGTSAAPVPYTGPYYYEGTTPYAPFDTVKGTGAVGYPLFGAQYFPKTIDSPYVAPRPRNQ
jgi:ABC-type phosphate transport system substrate-binding protein